jgi:hypothetical protein
LGLKDKLSGAVRFAVQGGIFGEFNTTVRTSYIMFAGIGSREPLRLSAWMCSGSRGAETNNADIDFLNQYAQGKRATEVYGKVLQWVTWIGLPRDPESAPLAGVKVELEKGSERFIALTKPDGSFSFRGIPAGEYQLTAKLAPYTSPPI